ncbi:MAG: CCA tRNA nucleotidyltransferase [Rhodobacteraceae bacterium]|nr:CCA tRNA nucleotidyltransferase [Paracoccaceae bacterium]
MKITPVWLDHPPVQAVIAALQAAGFESYFVGGCVRNAVLGIPATDIDIATNAHPDQTTAAARAAGLKAVPTGANHGTVTVVADGQGFEVTTYRRDVATDGRHAVVTFADSIEEDALRRDFTMNALYAGAGGQVLDPAGGLEDLRSRRVRFIEDPVRRIAEDRLRILRFFRLHAWYGDKSAGPDPEALVAVAAAVDGLPNLSRERITAELAKLLAAPDPVQATAVMEQCGALGQILPGASARVLGSVVLLEATAGLAPDWLRRLAAIGGSDADLRLSKSAARRLQAVQTVTGLPLHEAAYRHGVESAWDAAIINAVLARQPLHPETTGIIMCGAGARFPVAAGDLPALSGKALGKCLRQLEARWIASEFTATRAHLLAERFAP